MIRETTQHDFDTIHEIINDAAIAYKGIIPKDRWQDPYMSKQELIQQIDEGVSFFCLHLTAEIAGVMGIQHKKDVTLIRHAYVRTKYRNQGIGGKLLQHLIAKTSMPILIGTWQAADWAIDFYKKYDFKPVAAEEKNMLLKKYWNIPQRQIETSVVLASNNYNVYYFT